MEQYGNSWNSGAKGTSDYHPITALVDPRGREATAPPAAPSDPIPDTPDDIVRAIITPPPEGRG